MPNVIRCRSIWRFAGASARQRTKLRSSLRFQSKGNYIDMIAINVIVSNAKGGINSCDIPFSKDLCQFQADYQRLTSNSAKNCQSSFLEDYMIIGTSAMIATELDCIINQYTDKFCNPMVMWGKYRKSWMKTTLPVSF